MSKTIRSLALSTTACLALAVPVQVAAQASPSAYTSATRYDAMGRVTGTIAPDPDGAGALKHLATRTTYDGRGLPTKVETGVLSAWQSEAVAPASWGAAFTVHNKVETAYDGLGAQNERKGERLFGRTDQPDAIQL